MKKLSNIDFSFFIQQAVTDVNTETNFPLVLIFESGWLTIECPWRLRGTEIIAGRTDFREIPEKRTSQYVKDTLVEKKS